MLLWFVVFCVVFFFKQKTAYEMRISDWSSDVCSSDLSALLKVFNGGLEARQGVGGVGRVVEVDVGVDFGVHGPQGLAQQRSALHRLIAAAQGVVDRPLEVGLQQPVFLPRRELVVGSEAAEVEERRVEAGIVPVDQPEPLAIVEKVGRQQRSEEHTSEPQSLLPLP